jgi:hypothetical protein
MVFGWFLGYRGHAANRLQSLGQRFFSVDATVWPSGSARVFEGCKGDHADLRSYTGCYILESLNRMSFRHQVSHVAFFLWRDPALSEIEDGTLLGKSSFRHAGDPPCRAIHIGKVRKPGSTTSMCWTFAVSQRYAFSNDLDSSCFPAEKLHNRK